MRTPRRSAIHRPCADEATALLHGLEKSYLISRTEHERRTARKRYRAPPLGRKAINLATVKAEELFDEIAPGQRQPAVTGKR